MPDALDRASLLGKSRSLDAASESTPITVAPLGRLHFALALLSGLEFGKPYESDQRCPICQWPKGGHHGTRHEPGCSLEAVLTDQTPYRLLDLEQRYGDAAYGADLRDQKKYATPIVNDPHAA